MTTTFKPPYVDSLCGANIGHFPAVFDDMLKRSSLTPRVFTGTGPKDIKVTEENPICVQASMTGWELKSAAPSDCQVTAELSAGQLTVKSDPQIRWAVTVWFQQNTK